MTVARERKNERLAIAGITPDLLARLFLGCFVGVVKALPERAVTGAVVGR